MATQKKKDQLKFTAFAAVSIDGRIARSGNSGTDWTSQEDWQFFQKSLAKFDAVVVGHNTYKLAKKNLDRRHTLVLTHKTTKSKGSVVFVNPNKVDVSNLLRNRLYKKVAVLGGPEVYGYFLERGFLDEIYLTIEPYVFTAGVPLFSGKDFQKFPFVLLSTQKLNKEGTLLLRYKYAG